ncbi:hypothetical protein L596_007900 [Steinernema carpocapsae]|uniref:BTB domain-containing protein n=1 Tax=Steinernema carpocapsae TaxID=34508 RepID=A0A4U5PBC7_STECR|nr:hypothetical protein L596_007900 [Steinernema carpocapsae]
MPFSETITAKFSVEVGDEVSEILEVARMPWRILKRLNADSGYVELYANANADNESRMWSCDASIEFRILSAKGAVVASKNIGFSHFKANGSHLWGFKRFFAVEDLSEHLVEGRFAVEAQITVHQMSGVRVPPVFSFDQLKSAHSDCALVIEGEKIWISKSYLALYSPYFETLFFGDFAERNLDEIELKNVSKDEFVEFLQVIYPSHKPISERNVESLLCLADRFEVAFVTEKCEEFLLRSDCFSFAEKLLLSGQYRLCQLESRISASNRSTRSPISNASTNRPKPRSLSTSRKSAFTSAS